MPSLTTAEWAELQRAVSVHGRATLGRYRREPERGMPRSRRAHAPLGVGRALQARCGVCNCEVLKLLVSLCHFETLCCTLWCRVLLDLLRLCEMRWRYETGLLPFGLLWQEPRLLVYFPLFFTVLICHQPPLRVCSEQRSELDGPADDTGQSSTVHSVGTARAARVLGAMGARV